MELPRDRPFRGSTSSATRQQLRARRFRRVQRDVYLLQPADVTFEVACDAALLSVPGAVLSHLTAARLWRLPVPDDGLVHVVRPPGTGRSRLPQLQTHRAALSPEDLDVCRGRPVTSLPRTFVDLATLLPYEDLVAVGDVVARRTSPAALLAQTARAAGRRGVASARRAAAVADPGAASPGETRCRLLLHGAGFRELQHAVPLLDEAGQWLGEADLGDPAARVAVQYDGLVHFGPDVRQRLADVARDENARAAGWQVVVVTSHDLRQPHRAVAKVAAAYERAHGSRRGLTG